MSLTGFLKLAVDETISSRSSRVLAARIAEELLPLLRETEPAAPAVSEFKTFDRGCLDADLHRVNTVCQSCGGSSY
jgi:hypothetical protein